MNDTVIDNDSGCLESIHNISGVCYGEESINVDKFPKQTKRIVKNTLKYNPWLMSDYLSLNCMGGAYTKKSWSPIFRQYLILFISLKTAIQDCLDLFEFCLLILLAWLEPNGIQFQETKHKDQIDHDIDSQSYTTWYLAYQ